MSAHSVFWGEVLMANRMIFIVTLEFFQDAVLVGGAR
jgi:hypothetical protein